MKAFRLVWAGETQGAIRVDDFPNPPRTYKTIAYHVFDFYGTVTLEGSLVTNPTEDDWFIYRVENFTRPLISSSKLQNRLVLLRDRVIWLRAIVRPTIINLGAGRT